MTQKYIVIRNQSDQQQLQSDEWLLRLNIDKCINVLNLSPTV